MSSKMCIYIDTRKFTQGEKLYKYNEDVNQGANLYSFQRTHGKKNSTSVIIVERPSLLSFKIHIGEQPQFCNHCGGAFSWALALACTGRPWIGVTHEIGRRQKSLYHLPKDSCFKSIYLLQKICIL